MSKTINRLNEIEKHLLDIKIAVSMGDVKQVPEPLEQAMRLCKEALIFLRSVRLLENSTYGKATPYTKYKPIIVFIADDIVQIVQNELKHPIEVRDYDVSDDTEDLQKDHDGMLYQLVLKEN